MAEVDQNPNPSSQHEEDPQKNREEVKEVQQDIEIDIPHQEKQRELEIQQEKEEQESALKIQRMFRMRNQRREKKEQNNEQNEFEDLRKQAEQLAVEYKGNQDPLPEMKDISHILYKNSQPKSSISVKILHNDDQEKVKSLEDYSEFSKKRLERIKEYNKETQEKHSVIISKREKLNQESWGTSGFKEEYLKFSKDQKLQTHSLMKQIAGVHEKIEEKKKRKQELNNLIQQFEFKQK